MHGFLTNLPTTSTPAAGDVATDGATQASQPTGQGRADRVFQPSFAKALANVAAKSNDANSIRLAETNAPSDDPIAASSPTAFNEVFALRSVTASSVSPDLPPSERQPEPTQHHGDAALLSGAEFSCIHCEHPAPITAATSTSETTEADVAFSESASSTTLALGNHPSAPDVVLPNAASRTESPLREASDHPNLSSNSPANSPSIVGATAQAQTQTDSLGESPSSLPTGTTANRLSLADEGIASSHALGDSFTAESQPTRQTLADHAVTQGVPSGALTPQDASIQNASLGSPHNPSNPSVDQYQGAASGERDSSNSTAQSTNPSQNLVEPVAARENVATANGSQLGFGLQANASPALQQTASPAKATQANASDASSHSPVAATSESRPASTTGAQTSQPSDAGNDRPTRGSQDAAQSNLASTTANEYTSAQGQPAQLPTVQTTTAAELAPPSAAQDQPERHQLATHNTRPVSTDLTSTSDVLRHDSVAATTNIAAVPAETKPAETTDASVDPAGDDLVEDELYDDDPITLEGSLEDNVPATSDGGEQPPSQQQDQRTHAFELAEPRSVTSSPENAPALDPAVASRGPNDASNGQNVQGNLQSILDTASTARSAQAFGRTQSSAYATATPPTVQVAEAFQTKLAPFENQPTQSISLELNPPELGQIQINVEQSTDQIVAQIVATEFSSTEMLLQDKNLLLEALSDLGFEDTTLDISYGNSGDREPETQQRRSPYQQHAHTGTNSPADAPVQTQTSGINLLA